MGHYFSHSTTGGGGGGGAVTIADGADVAEGATTDVAVSSDTAGTVSGKLRGLVKILADVWDSVNHLLRISGTVTANIGTSGSLALDASVTGLQVAQASTTSGEKGPLVQAAVTTAAPSYTTGQTDPLSLNTAGGLRVDGSGVTQPVSGTVTANAGSGTFTISGTVTSNPAAVTSGGATPYKLISAASTNGTSVKGSAGQVYAIAAMNLNASPRYLKLYDKASAPTVGSDTPVHTYLIPGNTAGAGFTLSIPVGQVYANGIAFALTTGMADADTGAVAANEIVVNLDYK